MEEKEEKEKHESKNLLEKIERKNPFANKKSKNHYEVRTYF